MVPVREKFGKKKVLEPVPEKFGPGKSTSIGTGTIWYWYRKIPGNFSLFGWYRYWYRNKLVQKKVLVPVTEKFGPGKR